MHAHKSWDRGTYIRMSKMDTDNIYNTNIYYIREYNI